MPGRSHPPSPLWAIAAYFNPLHWQRRIHNYRLFREHLGVPLVTVELAYDGQFDLEPQDAEILLRFPARDVLWQKERLLNLALAAVPEGVENVACLDADVILERPDIWSQTRRALERSPLVQLFSHAHYLPADPPSDVAAMFRGGSPAPSFAWLRQQGASPLEACNPAWQRGSGQPPVIFGLGWAFRRSLFAGRGFYDPWVIGGGMRMHCLAGDGLAREAATAMRFGPAMRAHFERWARSFHAELGGQWGCVPGKIAHLWHGDLADRRYRQRYEGFARFDFDPEADVALDEHGCWRWSSAKPQMHAYVREYFAARREDGREHVLPQAA